MLVQLAIFPTQCKGMKSSPHREQLCKTAQKELMWSLYKKRNVESGTNSEYMGRYRCASTRTAQGMQEWQLLTEGHDPPDLQSISQALPYDKNKGR